MNRFTRFYRDVAAENGRKVGAERLLMAIYMRPEALFREELGEGNADKYGFGCHLWKRHSPFRTPSGMSRLV